MDARAAVDVTKEAVIRGPGEGKRINVLGDQQTIKLSGQETGGLFAMMEQSNAPGVEVPLHVHTKEDELFYVCEGEVLYQVGDVEIVATQGTTVYLPKGVPHGFHVLQQTRALLSVYPAGGEKMFLELSKLPPGPPDFERVKTICGEYGVYFF